MGLLRENTIPSRLGISMVLPPNKPLNSYQTKTKRGDRGECPSERGSASHFDLSHLRSGYFCAVTVLYAVGFLGGSLLNSRDLCDVLPGSEKGEHNAPQRRVGIKDPPRSQEPTTSHFLPSPFNERPDARTNLHEPPPSWSIRPRNPNPSLPLTCTSSIHYLCRSPKQRRRRVRSRTGRTVTGTLKSASHPRCSFNLNWAMVLTRRG